MASHEGRRNRKPANPAEAADSRTQASSADLDPWAQQAGVDTLLRLKVRPGAKAAMVVGVHGARLKVAIAAPPVEGRANDALLDLLAGLLGLPRRQLHLHAGATSRDKTVRVEAANAADVARRLVGCAQTAKH